jgi:hypothetical protein
MKSKIALICFLFLGWFNCFSQLKNFKTTFNETTEGMVVGTVCIENKSYSSYTFVYTDAVNAVADYANMSDSFVFKNTPGDFKEKGKTYFLFTIVKPEGNYKFAKIKIFDNSGESRVEFEVPLDLKFTIEKGKTTYLGQVTINIKDKKFLIENKSDRDKEWFNQKLPLIQF